MDTRAAKLSARRADIQEALLWNRRAVAERWKTEGHYGLDRLFMERYLDGFPRWEKKIDSYFNALEARGERVVCVDVCGRSSGHRMGADKTYTFSLQPVEHHLFLRKEDIHVRGDIFSMKDFYSFVALLRRNGDAPALVIFSPVAGLEAYTPWKSEKSRRTLLHREVTYKRLENNLRKMVAVLRPGGFIFIERPFQLDGLNDAAFFSGKPLDQYPMTLWLKEFCRGSKCSVEADFVASPYYLLRKWESRKPTRP